MAKRGQNRLLDESLGSDFIDQIRFTFVIAQSNNE